MYLFMIWYYAAAMYTIECSYSSVRHEYSTFCPSSNLATESKRAEALRTKDNTRTVV